MMTKSNKKGEPVSLNGTGGVGNVTGGSFPAAIWASFINGALEGEEMESFVPPGGTIPTQEPSESPSQSPSAEPEPSPSEPVVPSQSPSGQPTLPPTEEPVPAPNNGGVPEQEGVAPQGRNSVEPAPSG